MPPWYVHDKGLHYLFGLKGNQPALQAEAIGILGHLQSPVATSLDTFGSTRRVERRLYFTEQMAGFGWDHLRTVVRVESRTYAHGKLVATEDRYFNARGQSFASPVLLDLRGLRPLRFVSSLPVSRLNPKQWLRLIRSLWGVENAVHCTADKLMHEDQHPWIEADPKGALIVALLRRVAYNLLALFRSVTLRAQTSRCTPWKTLMRWVELALLTAGPDDLARLRPRIAADARAS